MKEMKEIAEEAEQEFKPNDKEVEEILQFVIMNGDGRARSIATSIQARMKAKAVETLDMEEDDECEVVSAFLDASSADATGGAAPLSGAQAASEAVVTKLPPKLWGQEVRKTIEKFERGSRPFGLGRGRVSNKPQREDDEEVSPEADPEMKDL